MILPFKGIGTYTAKITNQGKKKYNIISAGDINLLEKLFVANCFTKLSEFDLHCVFSAPSKYDPQHEISTCDTKLFLASCECYF